MPLFGLSSAPQRTYATFWLLEAADSIIDQSQREPDGTGLGFFDADGTPQVHKAPIAAYEDRCFAEEARQVQSTTSLAHVRFASTGSLAMRNTHPFEQDGRLLAHNGVIEDLDMLDAHLGEDRSLVQGDTDSERCADHTGDPGARRRSHCRHRAGGRLDRPESAPILAEPGPDHFGRTVGAALSRNP